LNDHPEDAMKKLLLIPAGLLVVATIALLGRRPAHARFDAISAASLKVAAKSITSTTAVIEYSQDKYDYGTRTLCYDPSPTSPTHNCTTKTANGNDGSFNVTGLKPGTKYNFNIKAVDTRDGEKPYSTTGSFTTLTATGVGVPVRATPVPGLGTGPAFDLRGRTLMPGSKASGRTYRSVPR
jgi:hypothetical protein